MTLAAKFFGKGMVSTAGVLIGLLAGYLVALTFGMVSFARVGTGGVVCAAPALCLRL
ncbi:hypothetical protein [Breoghania sp.]|uniref:hypothetical protein n=1 Tax=Breoghania sp. TaxID=2065378 RepID=UPI003204A7C0